MADTGSDGVPSVHTSQNGSALDLAGMDGPAAVRGSPQAASGRASPRAEANLQQLEVSRESAERMLHNVSEKSSRLGAAFARMMHDLQERSQRQVTNQVTHLQVHHEAVMQCTSELHEAVRSMNSVVASVLYLNSQLDAMSGLKSDVSDVLLAVKDLDRVVTALERRAGLK
eukprot:TRINITY_DN34153_c0_g1_i1.p1 TRINITY_DN34153_c0_g1~~TRINITY_DN34153_c0_g1_i1.p1  ORF type:complete len:180 (+),score=62.18 TRINITY_DN34153_c0_g1_i1:28-540(+)